MAKRLLLAYLLLILITGCAVNDMGFIKLRYFENETTYLKSQRAWGGYLSTRHINRGFVLGRTERIMVYPKFRKGARLRVEELLIQVDGDDFIEMNAKDIDLKNKEPFAWIEKNQGVMFHANPLKMGFSIGVESRHMLRLPPEFDGIFILKHDGDGRIEASVQGNLK